MFGYPIEPDFDLGKERRQDRVGWVLLGGLASCLVYMFSGGPHATEVFQGMLATILAYGISFYINLRGTRLSKPWVWKAALASVPVHLLYVLAIFWSDRAFPGLMTRALVFVWVLGVASVSEAIFVFDRIIAHFKAHADGTTPTSTKPK